jgi:hypothetical protein
MSAQKGLPKEAGFAIPLQKPEAVRRTAVVSWAAHTVFIKSKRKSMMPGNFLTIVEIYLYFMK